jgi:hypothetical protein
MFKQTLIANEACGNSAPAHRSGRHGLDHHDRAQLGIHGGDGLPACWAHASTRRGLSRLVASKWSETMPRDTGALSLMLLAVVLLTAILTFADHALSHAPRSVPAVDLSTVQAVAD